MNIFSVVWRLGSKIAILFLAIAMFSCNAVKKVPENDVLLTKNNINIDGEKESDELIENLILQKPNTNVLGYPLRLNIYNLAKENPDSLYQAWLQKKDKREERLNSFLSQKQVKRLGESFIVRGYSNLFKRIGEQPAILDTSKSRKSTERLAAYFGSKGYFNATADYEISGTKKPQRVEANYTVIKGKPYYIDSLQTSIDSKDLDSLYRKYKNDSWVKENQQFNLENFNNERQRLTNLFRNNGIYNFQESSITYTILRDTTQVADDQKLEVEMVIKNPSSNTTEQSSKPYTVHKFNKINIYTDYSFDTQEDSLKSVEYDGYTIFYENNLKYKPKALTDAVFFEIDSVYSDLNRTRTLRQITNLNTFKYPSIQFEADSTTSKLTSNIFLAPRPKNSLQLDFDVSRSDIQQIGVGLSSSITTRNVFGGSETLSLSLRGSVGILDEPISDENFTSEIGADINLTFPRIWLPFNTETIIPYYMTPQTRFSVGTNFQQNVGLDRQSLNSILSYNWTPSNFVKNTFELLNIEFVRNTNTNAFFREYSSTYSRLNNIASRTEYTSLTGFDEYYDDENNLKIPDGADDFIAAVTADNFSLSYDGFEEDLNDIESIAERKQRLTENNLIFASNFVYQKNNRTDINDNEFYQFNIKFESAGNFLSLAENIIPFNQSDTGKGLVFGVPYSQYLKTELDYIKHWDFSNSNVLAFRSFFGIAIPYGNSESIPFVRSYFAGGSNDNRAWNVYSLGPGRTNNENDFNEANLKIGLNLEYRFPLLGDFKGAIFADAGNIWNAFDNVNDPDATFNGLSSLKDIALGTGFGLRYDFTYFVIRLDTGFKTYNPALSDSNRWFSNFNLSEAVFNIGINYPF